MSEPHLPPGFIAMDGSLVLINILMSALRRQAVVALGGNLDASGHQHPTEGDPVVSKEDTKALMVKFCVQGLKDSMVHGMMGMDTARDFTLDVVAAMEKEASR